MIGIQVFQSVDLVFGIYQEFTASAEGYPYKNLDLLAGTLLI
jgi:hypothetical protein